MDTLLYLASALCLVALSTAVPVYQQLDDGQLSFHEDGFSVDYNEGNEGIDRVRRSASEIYDHEMPLGAAPEPPYTLARPKRATCDALSFSSKWLTINHSACAVHCIAKGYKGGRCKDAVCHCRR